MEGSFGCLKQLMRLLFAILGGLILAWALTFLVMAAATSFDLEQTLARTANLSEETTLLRLTQTISSLCLFVVPPIFLALLNRENPVTLYRFQRPGRSVLLLGAISIVVAVPFLNVLVTWNEGIHLPAGLEALEAWMRASETAANDLTEKILSGTSWLDLALNLLIIALLAGFGEELFFRGLLQQWLTRQLGRKHRVAGTPTPDWMMHISIWVVAIIFSAAHLQFFGFFPRLLMGAWFGYLLWWSGSIWVPMTAHMTNNALSTLFFFAQQKGWLTADPDTLGLGPTWWLTPLSIALFVWVGMVSRTRSGQPREGGRVATPKG